MLEGGISNERARRLIEEIAKLEPGLVIVEGGGPLLREDLFAHSGHGHCDMAAYDSYLSNKLSDYEYPEEKVKEALASLPQV